MSEFIQHLINGLSLGSIYALVALGYTMVFGILQLINFAHGDLTMLGAFTGFYLYRFFKNSLQIRPFFSFFVLLFSAMTLCSLVGFCIERLAYRPLRKAPRVNVLITAVGMSSFLEFSGQLLFGSEPQFFPSLFSGFLEIGPIRLHFLQIVVFLIAIILTAILQFFVFKTRFGRAMRAVSFQPEAAALMGVPIDRIISLTFVIGSALAGAAGVLIALMYPKIDPLMGTLPGIKAFTAAVLGGIGNIQGAVIGAFCLALAEEFIVGYWNPAFRDAFCFALLILVLLIKPTGLLGTKKAEKV
jgi:branched-chain amino acid transport system permease protein